MALDEALLARARALGPAAGEVVVRVYGWARPTLSFGRNQRAVGQYDPVGLAERGLDVVRRPTGGRAVLHWREVTYSVTAAVGVLAPAGAPLRVAYARINRLLVGALAALGVDAREARPAGRTPHPDGAPCFERPTAGEIVAEQEGTLRKLVGSAQWQDDGALLQHGSILIDDDQSAVATLVRPPAPPPPPPATLRQLLGRAPTLDEIAAAVLHAARVGEDPCADLLQPDEALREGAAARVGRYEGVAWTWRR